MKLFPLHLIPNDTKFDFMRTRWIAIGIAALVFIAALGSIIGNQNSAVPMYTPPYAA